MTQISNNPYLDVLRQTEQANAQKAEDPNNKQLDQEDFFKLLTQELSYQDPFKPVDNTQMISQMTSFSTLEGITKMTEEMESLNSVMTSGQALQVSGLVGKSVLIPSNTSHMQEGQDISGKINLPLSAGNVLLQIEGANGELLRSYNLGDQAAGNVSFSWDGQDQSGNPLPAGMYKIKATGLIEGNREELPVATFAHVDSVSLGQGMSDVVLNLQGLGGIKLNEVIEVAS
ncbi:flagellar hook assembly protein FlgD [Dongshaea marina]|uniref:flagellar hook assembly protein FlgD n=1 Tax=Dongshaea marina TaxID=2047966 RepID=UPI000D3ECFAA|nr:flagellar hook assembly protein FlgD [Dongshaea marina]